MKNTWYITFIARRLDIKHVLEINSLYQCITWTVKYLTNSAKLSFCKDLRT